MKRNSYIFLVFFLINLYSFPLKAQPERDLGWYDIEAVAQELEIKSDDWMADIGTRDGYYLNQFLSKLGEKGHIFAVDIDTKGFDDLHQYMKQWKNPNVSTIYSMETDPLLPASSLDAILIRNTYHEFAKPDLMLRNLKKALKRDGKIVISELFQESYKGKNRDHQEENHVIDIKFVINDLEEMGFEIENQINRFAENPNSNSGRYYWLLTAVPTKNHSF